MRCTLAKPTGSDDEYALAINTFGQVVRQEDIATYLMDPVRTKQLIALTNEKILRLHESFRAREARTLQIALAQFNNVQAGKVSRLPGPVPKLSDSGELRITLPAKRTRTTPPDTNQRSPRDATPEGLLKVPGISRCDTISVIIFSVYGSDYSTDGH